jgi:hypothetical protein
MIDFLMILSSLILHEGGAKTGYSSSGEEALPSHFAALNRAIAPADENTEMIDEKALSVPLA